MSKCYIIFFFCLSFMLIENILDIDKSWIKMPRNSSVYDQGVRAFIEFAFQHNAVNDMILCPCPTCRFS